MRYKCLVFDHDDTTVNSTAMIHYPSFVEFMAVHRPNLHLTLQEYVEYNFDPGVVKFFTEICGLSEKELILEQAFWFEYAKQRTSDAFFGIKEIMERQKREGGLTAVVSHSFASNILKDYEHNALPVPDEIFGWEQPPQERKPSPYPLYRIMEKYGLHPEDILVVDDLKPGCDMAKAAGCDFAAASWCFHIPANEAYMKANADYFCESVEDLRKILFK